MGSCPQAKRNRAEMTVGLQSEMGAYFLMSPDFRTTVWPCRPSGARTTADSHDPAGFGIAHALFHQLIIMSTCSVLGRRSPGLPPPFHLCQLQLLKAQVLQRPLPSPRNGSLFDHR